MRYSIFIWPSTELFLTEVGTWLADALRIQGHEVVWGLDLSGCIIAIGANASRHHHVSLPATAIVLNLEQLYEGSPWLTPEYLAVLRTYSVWDYNTHNQSFLGSLQIFTKKISIGYAPSMGNLITKNKDIDVLFYGCINDRRHALQSKLPGVVVFRNCNLWNEERRELVARSKIILNVHYYPTALFEIVRVAPVLAQGGFVITEVSRDQEDYSDLQIGMVVCRYEEIVEKVRYYLENDRDRESVSARGYDLIRERPFTVPYFGL